MTPNQKLWAWLLGVVPLIGLLIAIFGPTYPAGFDTPHVARGHGASVAVRSSSVPTGAIRPGRNLGKYEGF